MISECLVYIISPIHVISSISALLKIYREKIFHVTFLAHWPGFNTMHLMEIESIIQVLIKNRNFATKMISISSFEKDNILQNNNYSDAVRIIKKKIDKFEFDSIFYPHDVESGMYQLLCTVYPNAKRICFGDAFGNVYEKKVHLSFLLKNENDGYAHSFIKRIFNYLRSLNIKKTGQLADKEINLLKLNEFKPDAASLILPVDQSGRFLKEIPLFIPEKKIVMDVLNQSITNASDLKCYCEQLLKKYNNQIKWILLTDNFAEGNFIEFDKEIEMWISIISSNASPGDVIFLKSHPGETLERNKAIIEKIGNDYIVVELDTRFKRYPIEIWYDLIMNCGIICMSYPVLSLKYLYDVDVIQPMNDEFIEKWFPEWTWRSYKNSLSLYMEPLKRLPYWDGKSVLYLGKHKGVPS